MSLNVRKQRTYDDLDYNYLNKTLDISALSFHKMLQVAKKQDALNEYASVVALSYVAAQRTFFGYNDMADAKSLLESIARSFGYIYGREKNVRVNTISQSPTPTTAGSGVKGMSDLMDFADKGAQQMQECVLGGRRDCACGDWAVGTAWGGDRVIKVFKVKENLYLIYGASKGSTKLTNDEFWAVEASEEIRAIIADFRPKYEDFVNEVAYSQLYYQKLLRASEHFEKNPHQQRWFDLTLKAFEQRGIALPAEEQEQLKNLNKQLSELGEKFQHNVVDEQSAFLLYFDDEALIASQAEKYKRED